MQILKNSIVEKVTGFMSNKKHFKTGTARKQMADMDFRNEVSKI